jgi:hypothetical protein
MSDEHQHHKINKKEEEKLKSYLLAKYLRMTTVKRNTQEPRKIKH